MTKRPADPLEIIDLLLQESSDARYSDPVRMVYLAELAQAAANRLDTSLHSATLIADTQARVWAELGNAYRLADALDHSERAFAQSVDALEQGSGNLVLSAHVSLRYANLLCHRRRYEAAFNLLDRVAAAYLVAGESQLAGKTLLDRGAHALNSGDAEGCISYTAAGLELLGPDISGDLLLAGVHNVLAGAVELGHYEFVAGLLPGLRPLYGSKKLPLLRLRWLEARVAAGLGHLDEAEAAYKAARAGFSASKLAFPAALVSLDLTLVLVKAGRFGDVISLAEEMLETFRSLQLGREALLALLLLRQACEGGAQEIDLMQEAIATARKLVVELSAQRR